MTLASKNIAVIGTGPAGLMAASVLLKKGLNVSVFERRPSPGRKLLIAGSSGLNITHAAEPPAFIDHYRVRGGRSNEHAQLQRQCLEKALSTFTVKDWLGFIQELGHETYLGTSRRYFLKEMKSSQFLKSWTTALEEQGAKFVLDTPILDFEVDPKSGKIILHRGYLIAATTASLCGPVAAAATYDAVLFALGGASYEDEALQWPHMFTKKQIGFTPFAATNTGFALDLPTAFFAEAEGLPLKNIVFTSAEGSMRGDCVFTKYGIEGTPIYTFGCVGVAHLDLKPDWSVEHILERLQGVKENLSPIRRVKKTLNLGDAALALLFHSNGTKNQSDLAWWADRIKAWPIALTAPRPLSEAISSDGGVQLEELDLTSYPFMLKRFPGVFLAGEMLDWDAPTGGFWIQGCVSQGATAANGVVKFLEQAKN